MTSPSRPPSSSRQATPAQLSGGKAEASGWRIEPVGDSALILRVGEALSAATIAQVRAISQHLERQALAGVREVVPAYTTVTVHYRPAAVAEAHADDPRCAFDRLAQQILQALKGVRARAAEPDRVLRVPVWYGGQAGPDLAAVAAACGLSEAEVVRRHQASAHEVCMLGFAPGFPFITGLDPALAMPRRATPRTQVPAGSVAIANLQSCIYPLTSPGGWQLLGRTPLRLFDPQATPPSLLRAGDRLHFEAIDEARYHQLLAAPGSVGP